ncbi:SDR family NAD(P)-dependent oxidoreductase [Paracraurococcus lichenis]|uniref:SDR family NAD(P)-dependent oxidoreductase n=1 Tax=Paracraurococcus lichenis TaxID=3064888 RepID=A0ABT9E7K1_9PROT|nr:SDR family NAD(P)-dependent oxidoreductase [Paracraurococcus sp. LOR1-02]MDO9712143.1 SDR family NAD(P)-dependent oxidoreductase [Paracraurococcus sp. LOR1-02]
MPGMLEGSIAVITGGSTGIGLATARCFAAEGARVFVIGRRAAELANAVAGMGASATGIQASSSDLGGAPDMTATIRPRPRGAP